MSIEEKDSVKSATFTPSFWASFLLYLDEINSQLEKFAAGEKVAYRCYCEHMLASALWDPQSPIRMAQSLRQLSNSGPVTEG